MNDEQTPYARQMPVLLLALSELMLTIERLHQRETIDVAAGRCERQGRPISN